VKKWYTLDGTLSFRPGIELKVSAEGVLGSGNTPATFEATGVGTEGPTKGAIYELLGWVFAEQPIVAGGGRVLSVRGSVRALRGPDTKPEPNWAVCPSEPWERLSSRERLKHKQRQAFALGCSRKQAH
jgi:hypothetical protein